MVVDYLSDAASRSPSPEQKEFADFALIPDAPMSSDELFRRAAFLMRQSRNLSHPGYIGNMESLPTTMSIIGAMLMASTKNNMLAEEMAPFLTRIEPEVMKWFAARFRLGPNSGGGMLAGGTLANLQALTVARNARFGAKTTGIWGRKKEPVLFASEAAHSSLQKSAMTMGLGTSAVIAVRADANSRMDVEDLERKIQRSLDIGQEPFCVVATAGTTITGNIDPLADITLVTKKHNLWLHTDAIYGGALIFSNLHAQRLAGIDESDSVTFNLHKWAYLGTTSSMVLFKDLNKLEDNFRISAPYMNAASRAPNLGELSLQGSRQADIISLLLTLQHLGLTEYARLIDDRIQLAHYLCARLQATGAVDTAGEMDTNILCFRPSTSPVGTSTDVLAANLQAHLLHNENLCLTLPLYRGKRWLKADILNPFIDEALVNHLVDSVHAYILEASARRNCYAKTPPLRGAETTGQTKPQDAS
jgi:glutamate/tyrosine decarboxylase-like PLP-dependent enzyme